MENTGFDFAMLERNGGKPVVFPAGQTIFSEGQSGSVMYFICAGEVLLNAGGEDISTLWPGDIFGEMAMIDGSSRSAAALAKSNVEAIVMDRDVFLAVVREAPEFALHMLTILSVRVRELSCLI